MTGVCSKTRELLSRNEPVKDTAHVIAVEARCDDENRDQNEKDHNDNNNVTCKHILREID